MNEIEDVISSCNIKNPEEIFNKLKNEYDESELYFLLFNMFGYKPKNIEEREKRDKQQLLRNELLKKYQRCIITDFCGKYCETCHILPFSECSEDEKYDINNVLLLSPNIHTLFDNRQIKINPDTQRVELSNEILNDEHMYKHLEEYHGKKLNLNKQTIKYLKKSYSM